MHAFCSDTIHPDPLLRADHGVLRPDALRATADAREAAALIMAQARAQAAALALESEQRLLSRAARFNGQLEASHHAFMEQAQDMVIELAQAMFSRLVGALAPQERLAALYQRLRQEVPRSLTQPVFWIHPGQLALMPETDWEVRCDAALAPGACRLEAAEGEWRIDFESGLAALLSTLPASGARKPVHHSTTEESIHA